VLGISNIIDGFSVLSDRQIDDFVDVHLSMTYARKLTVIEDENCDLLEKIMYKISKPL
jgi:hypothetical protein